MVFASSNDAGMTFLITSSMRSLLICSLVTVSSCCVEMSTVCTRCGTHGAAFVLVLDVTCVLPSGRTHGQVPFLRTSVSL